MVKNKKIDEIKHSSFYEENGICIVKVGADVYHAFITKVLDAISAEAVLAIVVADNSFNHVVGYTTILSEKIKAKGICVVCILKELPKMIVGEYRVEDEIEMQLEKVKESSNTLIITKKEHTFQEVTDVVLCFYKKIPDIQAELLAERFSNGGFSYYITHYCEATINLSSFVERLILYSLRSCPVYMAKQVFCSIVGGSEFLPMQDGEWGDQGILLSYLQDYLDENVLLISETEKNGNFPSFGIKMQMIIGQLGERYPFYDAHKDFSYPVPTDKRLWKRIRRIWEMTSLDINKKREKYDRILSERNKENSNTAAY